MLFVCCDCLPSPVVSNEAWHIGIAGSSLTDPWVHIGLQYFFNAVFNVSSFTLIVLNEYCVVLYSTVLFCTVLEWSVLYWRVLYCLVLYYVLYHIIDCTVLYCNLLYWTVVYILIWTLPYYIIGILIYCSVLWRIVLYYTKIDRAVLYCNLLYKTVLICTQLCPYCTNINYCIGLICTILFCGVLYLL